MWKLQVMFPTGKIQETKHFKYLAPFRPFLGKFGQISAADLLGAYKILFFQVSETTVPAATYQRPMPFTFLVFRICCLDLDYFYLFIPKSNWICKSQQLFDCCCICCKLKRSWAMSEIPFAIVPVHQSSSVLQAESSSASLFQGDYSSKHPVR